ncbi:unnamed protein product [Parnassius apollo]|uniref:(apollo) hypothetical protein n=1 Tax=Parnassius apollo TaxID=110799 RepID=A0A8S3YAN5_PARAO|nr:unnamed protein product [Parnassius apollo]
MAFKCSACGKYMSPQDGANVTCTKCNKQLARACVGIAVGASLMPSWACPVYKLKEKRCNKDTTPVKPSTMTVANSSEVSNLGEEFRCFREEMRQTREEFRAFIEELWDIRNLVSKCDAMRMRNAMRCESSRTRSKLSWNHKSNMALKDSKLKS